MLSAPTVRLAALTAMLLVTATASAESLVVNGSLQGSLANAGVPTAWLTLEGTPDTLDASGNVGVSGSTSFGLGAGVRPVASPDGGTWVGLARNGSYIERFGQTLQGLSVGQTYTLSWYAGNFGVDDADPDFDYLGANAIEVLLDNTRLGQGGTLVLGQGWREQSLSFVATGSSQLLSFRLASTAQSYLSIDGIRLQAGGVAPAVPEPGTWALLALGLAGVVVAKRARCTHQA